MRNKKKFLSDLSEATKNMIKEMKDDGREVNLKMEPEMIVDLELNKQVEKRKDVNNQNEFIDEVKIHHENKINNDPKLTFKYIEENKIEYISDANIKNENNTKIDVIKDNLKDTNSSIKKKNKKKEGCKCLIF
jgi:hypothetical protein